MILARERFTSNLFCPGNRTQIVAIERRRRLKQNPTFTQFFSEAVASVVRVWKALFPYRSKDWTHPLYSVFYHQGYDAQKKSASVPLEEKIKLLKLAEEKYSQAIAYNPKSYDAMFSLGLCLQTRAKLTDEEESSVLLRRAEETYCKVTLLNPSHVYSWDALGRLYHSKATTKSGEEAEKLWAKACESYSKAAEIEPKNQTTLQNWAIALTVRAIHSPASEALEIYDLAL